MRLTKKQHRMIAWIMGQLGIIAAAVIALSPDKISAIQPTIVVQKTGTPISTQTLTLGNTPPLQFASTPIARNTDWMPIEQDFDGVMMVLVPIGCFEMGKDADGRYFDGEIWMDRVPNGGKQCFEQPFWLDKYEVTNEQFKRFNGVAKSESYWSDNSYPRDTVNWFEARDFCAKRGARLPTEREWEYAARGPDNLIYPWGNEWNPDNLIWNLYQSAEVGSKIEGMAWIGAMDLSGGVWEWVSSVYQPYPYQKDDRREQTDGNHAHVLRGGSWGDNSPDFFRMSFRLGVSSDLRNFSWGFRCARSLATEGENREGNFVTTTPEATIDETTLSPIQLASTPVAHNADWTPVEQDFDGVTMVLVPVGCFMMGNDDYDDEKPAHQQCFEQPFWLDKYEVTNGQFAQFDGMAANESRWAEDNRPRENISWFDAQDFCVKRGARLPTEREWEYGARGPDSLIYPWGNEWNSDNLIWRTYQTDEVGSKIKGISWVGALDLSGNVWEWVSNVYQPYPYQQDDKSGQLDIRDARVLRGSSWWVRYSDYFRASYRLRADPAALSSLSGFRCDRSIK